MSYKVDESNYIEHHGILGMKWGVRRFQPYPKGEGNKGRFVGPKNRALKRKSQENQYNKLKKATDPSYSKARRRIKDREFDRILKVVADDPTTSLTAQLRISKGRKIAINTLKYASNVIAWKYISKYVFK